jgi:tRNA-modifying protein YgfZ
VLDIEGAVEADWPDEGVAAHYGDPLREQRVMSERQVLVDRSNRGVVKITGPDRLSWLHSLTSQHLERLTPGDTIEALVLSPQGHLEHHLTLTDDGTATWIHVEPHTAPALVEYLNSMRFMLRVEVEDLSGVLVVQTLAGPFPAEGGPVSRTDRDSTPPASLLGDGVVEAVMHGPFGTDLIVAPAAAGKLAATFPVAGMWALEAARIAARIARPGLDTDHRTLPHEVGLIETAVHLNKGCYRGQETVARIQNLGHPPRRLVFLHLDGSADRLPAHGSELALADGTQVGFTGSAANHFELGPIGLGLVKRTVPVDAGLLADGIAAAQEVVVPPDAGANVRVTLRRDSVPQPPAGRRTLLSAGWTDLPVPRLRDDRPRVPLVRLRGMTDPPGPPVRARSPIASCQHRGRTNWEALCCAGRCWRPPPANESAS